MVITMRHFALLAAVAVLLSSCSKKEEAPAAPAGSAAAPAAAPAGAPAANPEAATEKHQLHVNNYPKTPVTVTVNGEWVGQWDKDVYIPLTMVAKGKNSVVIELGGQPDKRLDIEIQANRGNSWVNLVSFDYNGKSGSQQFSFVAK